MLSRNRYRRGAYAPLFVLVLLVILAIGTLSLDIARLGQCRVEASGVAANAVRSGLVVLRRTGDTGQADGIISSVVSASAVCGATPTAPVVTWGTWDDTAATPGFDPIGTPPNAVKVTVARESANAVESFFGGMYGVNATNIRVTSVGALRSVHWVIVVDQQNGWTESSFNAVVGALTSAIDNLGASAAPADAIAIIGNSGPYAWEITPMSSLSSASGLADVDADLAKLGPGSFAGTQVSVSDGLDCTVYTGANTDDFDSPAGGCYPEMPRRYSDEDGLDLSVGLELARAELLAAQSAPAPVSYRGVIVVTADPPAAVPAGAGNERANQGYSESRYVENIGVIPSGVVSIRSNAELSADALWDDLQASTWVLAWDTTDPLFSDLVRGDGWAWEAGPTDDIDALAQALFSASPIVVVQ